MYYLLFFVVLKFALLMFASHELSISAVEAREFFDATTIAGKISSFGVNTFGMGDIGARSPFLLFHFLSIMLFFELTKPVMSRYSDRVFATVLFMFLPGVSFSAILINKAGVIIFLTLLLLVCLQRGYLIATYALLFFYSLIDSAFAILFLSLAFYAMRQDNKKLLIVNILLFTINIYLFGFDTGGKPKSMFLDTFGVYLAIFSPLVFLYFVYSLYKSFRLGLNQPAIYISFWALVFSLILSIRQKINFEDFAPFVVLSVLFMVPVFFSSYRVRLRPFRRSYKALGYALVASLAIFTIVPFASKALYPIYKNPKSNFAYNYHIAKELSYELKKRGISSVSTGDEELQMRLRFYGIRSGGEYKLSKNCEKIVQKVSIIYTGVEVATFYVTKVNTL